MRTAPSIKSTANHPAAATAYTPSVKLTAHRGWYRVQSGTTPGVYYETSVNSCTCPARKPCKHQKFVRSLNVAFFIKKEVTPAVEQTRSATTSGHCMVCGEYDHYLRAGLCVLCEMDSDEARAAAGDIEIAQAEQLLAIKHRALADAHPQDDSYATLLRAVDQAERTVAALSYSAMRAA